MVDGLRIMVNGSWSMMYGIQLWYMVHGSLFVSYHIWFMVYYLWFRIQVGGVTEGAPLENGVELRTNSLMRPS
jgi:hypothetical protein